MPKIIVNAFLTLDGIMQAPGGPDEDPEGGFLHGGWMAPYGDDVMGRLIMGGVADADGFILGRKTYDIFANHWPKVTDPDDPIATALNSRPKYVLSRSIERLTWNNSRVIEGDAVAELQKLREQPGRTLQTWGSADLLQTLLRTISSTNTGCSSFRWYSAPASGSSAAVRYPPRLNRWSRSRPARAGCTIGSSKAASRRTGRSGLSRHRRSSASGDEPIRAEH